MHIGKVPRNYESNANTVKSQHNNYIGLIINKLLLFSNNKNYTTNNKNLKLVFTYTHTLLKMGKRREEEEERDSYLSSHNINIHTKKFIVNSL